MKKIFEKLGYSVSETASGIFTEEVKLLVIHNPDGSIRWAWPANLQMPLFLKFYNKGSFKSGMFMLLVRLIFLLKLQKMVFKRHSLFIEPESDESSAHRSLQSWALFTGTTGINNKAVLYSIHNNIGRFTKIATSENASLLLQNETYALDRLYASNIRTFKFPDTLNASKNTLVLSDLSVNGTRVKEYGNMHTTALVELNEISSFLTPLCELGPWNEIKTDLNYLLRSTDKRIPQGMLKKLNRLIENTNEFMSTEMCFSHGDFTPWNMFEEDHKLNIYDWELSSPLRPLAFDAFHFIIQQGILVERKSWKDIKKELELKLNENTFTRLSKFNSGTFDDYLKLYLIFNCVNYLKIYSQQTQWHPQINWLLNTWNEALSDLSDSYETQRELILLDTFDFLGSKKYATIKFPNILPEKLSKYSDVDLCIEKHVNSSLYAYLSSHPLVHKIKSANKSFMANHQIICKDGSVLSLDLIWQIKRKSLVMLSASELLNQSYTNSFGVKTLDLMDNVRYIGLFYALNGFSIPEKYKAYHDVLRLSDKSLDRELLPYFVDNEGNSTAPIMAYLKNMPENKDLQAFKNKLSYITDTIRSFFALDGMIITFSGVDGAGKSTIIEKVKYRLEKQLRKRVIVIRHRPSILPILSALTKGKKEAEKVSASRLPRQGNNSNFVSSFIRFGYYYLDYLIGQFIVYFKYVSRGYVVLYDRYYYDFINDSKRSNIVLPSNLIRAGFGLIMKPKFNFFLYAKSETILERKKELDAKTIDELTEKYLKLFQSLQVQNKQSHFKAIENIELNATLDVIFNNISKNAA